MVAWSGARSSRSRCGCSNMTTDHRPPTTDYRCLRLSEIKGSTTGGMPEAPCHLVTLSPCHPVIRWLSFVALCAGFLLNLTACGAAPGDTASQADTGGGSRISPDVVAR